MGNTDGLYGAGGNRADAAILLFIANTLWTIAYDTQYAMVDREFDKKIGVKSTAILFGDADKAIIGVLQAMFIAAMYLAGQRLALGSIFNTALLAASVLLVYQQILNQRARAKSALGLFSTTTGSAL